MPYGITVLPATRQRCESRLYPQLKQVLDLVTLYYSWLSCAIQIVSFMHMHHTGFGISTVLTFWLS